MADASTSGSSSHLNTENELNPMRQSQQQPPRSPGRKEAALNSSTKKSPKKRSHEESTASPIDPTQRNLANNNFSSNSGSLSTNYNMSGAVNGETEDSASVSRRQRSNFDVIPQFYFPSGSAMSSNRGRSNSFTSSASGANGSSEEYMKKQADIEAFFKPYPGGIPVDKFVHMTKRLCGLPSFFNLPLCKRIQQYSDEGSSYKANRGSGGAQVNRGVDFDIKIKLQPFLKYWLDEIEPFTHEERFFRAVKQPNAEYIVKEDFNPYIQELLHFHPGLDFLDGQEEFQKKYALTVVTRIFYRVNRSRSGKISLRELKNSNLIEQFMHVDEEVDINKVCDYFSYEHFYVLYCRFFELDSDRDLKLSRDDLLKFGEHSLSEAAVDRIFQVGTRAFTDGKTTGDSSGQPVLTYPDFVYFFLSEEDKSTDVSLAYWFNCCDIDGDGIITPEDMRYFYKSQLHRVTSLGQDSVNFPDVLCQMMDLINPKDDTALKLSDFTKPDKRAVSGILFDVLFNLNKFMRFESRDPFQEKMKRDDSFNSDWDRFANMEYHRLAAEEEGYNNDYYSGGNRGMEVQGDYRSHEQNFGGWEDLPTISDDEEGIDRYR